MFNAVRIVPICKTGIDIGAKVKTFREVSANKSRVDVKEKLPDGSLQ